MRILMLAVAAAMTVSAPAFAKKDKHEDAGASVAVSAQVRFSPLEHQLIVEYYESHSTNLKSKPLPPGIRKKLARGGTLPPGIAKQQLAPDLAARLPPAPAGYERVIIDGRVLLVDIATQVVHDVLSDIIIR